jgi:hypothetical protein
MPPLYEDLKWNDGQINPSGIRSRVFYAQKSWVKTWPAPTVTPATPEESVELAGDFEMNTGKVFQEIYSKHGKSHVDFDEVGDKDHKMFINKLVGMYPDISSKAKAIAKNNLNSNVIFIAQLPHETEKRFVVIGSEEWDNEIKFTGKSGEGAGSEKGLFFECHAPDTTPLPDFKGLLPVTGGSIDCETGVFTPTP